MPSRTKKKGASRSKRNSPGRHTPTGPSGSRRYTPPLPRSVRRSGKVLPWIIGGFIGVGLLVILMNYLWEPSWLDMPSNWYVLGSISSIAIGFAFATRWR